MHRRKIRDYNRRKIPDSDIEGKKAFYEKLVEIKDSNGAKTLDMDGVMNNYRDAWEGSDGLGEDEVKTGTPALYFIDDEDVIVSNEAYVEVDAVNIVYGGEDSDPYKGEYIKNALSDIDLNKYKINLDIYSLGSVRNSFYDILSNKEL